MDISCLCSLFVKNIVFVLLISKISGRSYSYWWSYRDISTLEIHDQPTGWSRVSMMHGQMLVVYDLTNMLVN